MLSVIILAAGQGTRMYSKTPKILHKVAGKCLVHHVIDTALALHSKEIVAVLSPSLSPEKVVEGRPIKIAIQHTAQGTGDATRVGLEQLDGPPTQNVLILCGDVPLLQPEDLIPLLEEHQQRSENPGISVLGMRLEDPRQYGRLVTEGKRLQRIVEYKDASDQERQINLCNSGVILTSLANLQLLLPQLTCANQSQEYYLTDIIELGQRHGIESYVVEAVRPEVFHGINNRVELAKAEQEYQDILRTRIMRSGVTLIDPKTTYFQWDTVVGKDTIIYPNVCFGEQVVIGENVTVYPNCYLTKTHLANNTKVGPFAHLREYTYLEEAAEIGNFVEVKKSTFGKGAKAKHLAYIGDAWVGEQANIGAGVITCNYDGRSKHQTIIGDSAFIGSNSSLVAPVTIGEGAIVGAGSTITKDIDAHALGIARSKQEVKTNWKKQQHSKVNKG